MKNTEINVMANIKMVEILKAQLLCIIGKLFRLLTRGTNIAQGSILECMSGAIILIYVLAQKLGYSIQEVDNNMYEQLKLGIKSEDDMEKDGKSLSKLKQHITKKNNNNGGIHE